MVEKTISLVTGCAGFIGSHLAERLLYEGHVVTGIDCFTDYYPKDIKKKNLKLLLENEDFTFMEKNILDIDLDETLRDVDYVFHQAAQAGVKASWGESFKIYTDYNILGTQRLLEACKGSKIKKFVYGSSSSIYGDVSRLPMEESFTPKPISPYGVSKLAGEHLCYLYWMNFGVPTISLRYFTVYGPRQRPDMAFHKFVRSITEGKKITIYGDGSQTRDFTFVSDIVEANLLASKSELSGEVFNIGGSSRISVNEIIKILERLTGKKAMIAYIEEQKGDVRDTYSDISKSGEILGYSPTIGIEEGLRRFVDWFSIQDD